MYNAHDFNNINSSNNIDYEDSDTIDYDTTVPVHQMVTDLNRLNFEMARIKAIKEEIEALLIAALDHNKEGQKTYTVNEFAVTVKTDIIYSLDKAEYQVYKSHISSQFDPVKEKISYEIDKKTMREIEIYAGEDELLTISKFISKKPAKASVKISAAV